MHRDLQYFAMIVGNSEAGMCEESHVKQLVTLTSRLLVREKLPAHPFQQRSVTLSSTLPAFVFESGPRCLHAAFN
jgi:hypothetical protein